MDEKYPYVKAVEISRYDERRSNDVKCVKVVVYTSYRNDNKHTIIYGYDGKEIHLQTHRKDYGTSTKGMDKRRSDIETAREVAGHELTKLGLSDADKWDKGP